jgi:hypothetical protein
VIDHTPDRCGYVSDDPQVTIRPRADGWRCAKVADHLGSHVLYTAEGERVLHSTHWKRGDWIPAAPEQAPAPTLPRKVERHSDLQIGQRVAIEHIYSETRSLIHTGLVSDVMLEGVNLEGLVNVRAIADPHFDVEITVLAEAPEPEPDAWVVHANMRLRDIDKDESIMVGPFATREEAQAYGRAQDGVFQARPMYAPKEAQ